MKYIWIQFYTHTINTHETLFLELPCIMQPPPAPEGPGAERNYNPDITTYRCPNGYMWEDGKSVDFMIRRIAITPTFCSFAITPNFLFCIFWAASHLSYLFSWQSAITPKPFILLVKYQIRVSESKALKKISSNVYVFTFWTTTHKLYELL